MNQSMLTTTAGVAIVALGGIILIWWLTGHLKSGGVRKLLRLVFLPLFFIGVGGAGFVMARGQTQITAQTTTIQVVSESMPIQMGTLTQTLSSTGALEAADKKTLTFSTAAPVTAVSVAVGDQVHKGAVLAQVDTTALDANIRDAQINLKSAQASLTALKTPATDLQIKIAQASVDAAKASLSAASQTGSSATDIQIAQLQEELAKNSLWQSQLSQGISSSGSKANQTNAYANSVAAQANLASAETNVQIQTDATNATVSKTADASQLSSANAQLISAQANLNTLLAGATDAELRQAEINVETAQLTLDAAQQARTDAELVAPFDGIVASVDVAVGEMPGSSSGITLIDTSHYTTTLSVDEKDITKLAVGQQVNLTVQALNNAQISGTVTGVDPTPASTTNLVTYDVEVTLSNSSAALRPGMTAVANVILNQLKGVIVVPNRFITTNATTGKSTVKVETAAGVYNDTPVTLGTATDTQSVVTSGLSVGQTIVILASGSSSTTTQSNSLGLLGGLGGAAGGPPNGGGAPPSGGFPSGGSRGG